MQCANGFSVTRPSLNRSVMHLYITHALRKHFLNEQKVVMLLQKRTDTRGVGISSMRKSIYLLTTTPTSHTHLLLTIPTSYTHTFHPLSTIVIHTFNLCKVQAWCPKMITTVPNDNYSERSFFSSNCGYQWVSKLQLIPLVSIVWGLSVVGGIRGKQMMP